MRPLHKMSSVILTVTGAFVFMVGFPAMATVTVTNGVMNIYTAPVGPLSNGDYWRWHQRIGSDPYPNPQNSSHQATWDIENGDSWNIPFTEQMEKVFSADALPSGAIDYSASPPFNIIFTLEDYTDTQKATLDSTLDLEFTVKGWDPISDFKIGNATWKYNCHAYMKGATTKLVDSNDYFLKTSKFPVSSSPDWDSQWGENEYPNRAAHGSGQHMDDHSSFITWVDQTVIIGCTPTTLKFPRYAGKWGENAVYRTELRYVEYFGPDEDQYKE